MEGTSSGGIETEPAIIASNIYKSYKVGRKQVHALNDLSIHVPVGAIYGLLGPSGCGKTSLLRCVVGATSVDAGFIRVLGSRPGSYRHEVPGKRVGYMPQEMALYNEFSISETLSFFGRLHGMKRQDVEERKKFLITFLDLPEAGRRVDKLSGGQRRRVSFAIALLQEPELLILDEPTVGVDPLLRERIWEHLLTISRSSKTTIVITTHYIEEARQASMVGLIRSGRCLAEAPPGELMLHHSLPSLEEVFLKLCSQDESRCEGREIIRALVQDSNADEQTPLLNGNFAVAKENSTSIQSVPIIEKRPLKQKCLDNCMLPKLMNIFALILKNLVLWKGNPGFVGFEFILPAFQIVFFCLCVGPDPRDLNVATVNWDTGPFGSQILQHIDNDSVIQKDFVDFEAAYDSVRKGDCWAVMKIPENFTTDLMKRYLNPTHVTEDVINGSSVYLYLDMTDQMIYLTIEKKIFAAFQAFVEELFEQLGEKASLASNPLVFGDPVYGEKQPRFTEFMAPGVIISITFFMATGLTALSFVMEKKQGILERSFVAGVNAIEVMIGHICTQLIVMCVQVGILLTVTLAVFGIPYKGPLILVVVLTLFQGFVGMAVGLLVSAICEQENTAIMVTLSSVYPNMLISGIIWPIEAMPTWLRYISYCLPMTYAAQAMRSILGRGWDLTHTYVWRGFLMSIGWGWALLALTAVILTVKR